MMVISPRYKYLFVEIPQTGCTAVADELCAHYDGQRVLHKHATLNEFRHSAKCAKAPRFVFAGVRNPLDVAVSLYLKYKNNHKANFQRPEALEENGGFVTENDLERFQFTQNPDHTFEDFFRRYLCYTYNNYYLLGASSFDMILRFENLNEDFAAVLEKLSISPVRPLPIVNKTSGKQATFWSFYTPSIRPLVFRHYGPFFEKWGYTFPPDWGNPPASALPRIRFRAMDLAANTLARFTSLSPHSNHSLRRLRDRLRRPGRLQRESTRT